MTTQATPPITELTEDESWARLSSVSLGRLAICVNDAPDVFPVNFAVQHRTIVIRTAEGTKLAAAAVNPQVAFEADLHDVEKGWSVVVHGLAHVVSNAAELADADRAQVMPWTATTKLRYLRIEPTRITGRQFHFGGSGDPASDFGALPW